ncbi:MAG: family 16 glycoside hydrolase, partial [Planctomycetota bacterium]|nr:family 16 glycoside hydrolase [Planctomycetota bacterium]
VDGYVVRINTSFPDGSLTGSISRGETAAAVRTELVATDTWADLEVDVRNGEGGATVVVSLNGVEVNRVTDPDPLPAGGLALRNDHEGTVVKFQNLRIAR